MLFFQTPTTNQHETPPPRALRARPARWLRLVETAPAIGRSARPRLLSRRRHIRETALPLTA